MSFLSRIRRKSARPNLSGIGANWCELVRTRRRTLTNPSQIHLRKIAAYQCKELVTFMCNGVAAWLTDAKLSETFCTASLYHGKTCRR